MKASYLGTDEATGAAEPGGSVANRRGGEESAAKRPAGHDLQQPLLVSAEGLAKLLDISKRSLWRLRSAGRLPRPVRLGGTLRWRVDEVRAWIDAGCPSLDEWDVRCGRGR